jgi:hypothetical protein
VSAGGLTLPGPGDLLPGAPDVSLHPDAPSDVTSPVSEGADAGEEEDTGDTAGGAPGEATPARKLTAHDLVQAVRARYEPPEWHVEGEVTLAGRRLDLVALNLWGARQYRIVGFEVKVSRGDWLRELADYRKSEEWMAVVDTFYVVTAPKVIQSDELPEGWGHLELVGTRGGSRMMTRRHATARAPGATLPREVAARFLGRMAETLRQQDRGVESRARMQLWADIERQSKERHEKDRAQDRAEVKRLTEEQDALYAALGIERSAWRKHERALRAAAAFAEANQEQSAILRQLENVTRAQETRAAELRRTLDALKADAPAEGASHG